MLQRLPQPVMPGADPGPLLEHLQLARPELAEPVLADPQVFDAVVFVEVALEVIRVDALGHIICQLIVGPLGKGRWLDALLSAAGLGGACQRLGGTLFRRRTH